MSTIPTLKTGSLLQYPSARSLARRVRILRFVDGTEQRFPLDGAAFGQWRIAFSQLDDLERRAFERFAEESAAAGSAISIVDPWDGLRHDGCHLEGNGTEIQIQDRDDSRIELLISEEPE